MILSFVLDVFKQTAGLKKPFIHLNLKVYINLTFYNEVLIILLILTTSIRLPLVIGDQCWL